MQNTLLNSLLRLRSLIPRFFLASLLFLLVGTLYSYNYIFNSKVIFQGESKIFIVEKGQDFNKILANLSTIIKIDNPLILSVYARTQGFANKIHAGEYELSPNMSPITVFSKLQKGDVKRRKFTIVEGWNIYNLLNALQNDKNLVHNISYDDKDGAIVGLPMIKNSAEGAYYPDTYYYTYPDSDTHILKMANNAMLDYLNNLSLSDSCKDKSKDNYSILTLASLLEKEASDIDEMAIIAGVINNRLKKI